MTTEEPCTDLSRDIEPWQHLASPNMPVVVAVAFLDAKHFTPAGERTLHWWRGAWMIWRGSHWEELTVRALRGKLYRFTAAATYGGGNGNDDAPKQWAPTERKITDLVGALASLCELSDEVEPGNWLDGRTTGTIVAAANGLLDIATRQLQPHSATFFNTTAVPFAYDPAAPAPREWYAFLDAVWPSEDGITVNPAQDLLQEWTGYLLSGRTDFQKMLMLHGPTRGGRGTIGRVLTALLGKSKVVGLRLDDLGDDFGMAHLIDKSLAIIGDERFSGKNMAKVVSMLLMATGEDVVPINRKRRDYWIGRLTARIMLFSNELQKLVDASAAIIGRILVLRMTLSWLGREDLGLADRLLGDLPGILNWGLDGLDALLQAGRFTTDPAAADTVMELRGLASPIQTYADENCDIGEEHQVERQALYHDHCNWRRANGHVQIASNTFGVSLRAAFPHIVARRGVRPDGQRVRFYAGIGLKRVQGGRDKATILDFRPQAGQAGQATGQTEDQV